MSIDHIAAGGKRVKDDRTISRLDGLQYALEYVVNIHGWHLVEKLFIAGSGIRIRLEDCGRPWQAQP